MKKFFTLALLLSSLTTFVRSEDRVIFDFTDQEQFNQCESKDNSSSYYQYKWNYVGKSSYSEVPAYLTYTNYNGVDTYLMSPNLALESGHLYKVRFIPMAYYNGYTINAAVCVGQGTINDVKTFDVISQYNNVPYHGTWNWYEADVYESTFVVPAAGDYRVGFHVTGDDAVLMEARIYDCGESAIPAAVADFKVYPDSNGESMADVSFTMPSTTVTGQAISGDLSYNVYRGGTLLKSGTAAAGSEVKFTDKSVAPGNATYAVEIVNGDEKSVRVSCSTYIGQETPSSPSNVAASGFGGNYKVTWTAPEIGTHGALLDQSKIKYTVTRVAAGESSELATVTGVTEYSDRYESNVLGDLYYEVKAAYGSKNSGAVKSNILKTGSASLPFADSFAGAKLDEANWDVEIIDNDRYYWKAAANIGQSEGTNFTLPVFDGDGGCVYYNFYNATRGSSARLMTMPFEAGANANPVLDFALWRYGNNTDCIKVQVQVDNGEWQDVTEYYNAATEDDPAYGTTTPHWYKYSVNLADYIQGANVYRVGFLALSNYGNIMGIDAVRIFNQVDRDLEMASISAPAEIIAGNDLELVLNIANNGKDVKADDYSIVIDSNFPDVPAVETVDLAGLESRQITVKLPVTAEEAYETPAYSFSAKVVYNGDELPENNESEEISVQTAFAPYNSPSNFVAAQDVDSAVNLSWERADDPNYKFVDIKEDFESLEEDATRDFNGWVSLDLDGSRGDNYYGASSSEFTVTYNTNIGGYKGNHISVNVASNAQQNDWLISPRFEAREGSEVTFSARIAVKDVSSSLYKVKVSALYSEQDSYDPANPAASFKEIKTIESGGTELAADRSFHRVTFKVPVTAKYVALNFTTKTTISMAMYVDDLQVVETDVNPVLGYHVYERGAGRVNDEALAAETTQHTVSGKVRSNDVTRSFYATAIYGSGESAPSNLSSVTTEVADIIASGVSIAPVSGGVLVNGYDGEIAAVYSLDGACVASLKCSDHTVISLSAGVYVVKVGNDVKKVLVK